MIENVGNLVCPAPFDLGETVRVAILSVTEGDDKPAKYPHMFQGSDLIVVNKIDVLPCVDFDIARSIDRSDWIIRQLDKTEYCAFAAGDAVSSGVPRS